MERRGFLSALITAGVAAAADPERLLWMPGRLRPFDSFGDQIYAVFVKADFHDS